MSSCGSGSSNLSGNIVVNNFNNVGARLVVPISLSGFSGGAGGAGTWKGNVGDLDGVTVGDAVFYDAREGSVSEGKFTTSLANSAETSEVFGVIESADNDIANVVMYGQINYPMSKMHYDSLSISGFSGGNDVFFLSDATAGVLTNISPTTIGNVAKPVMTGATLGDYNAVINNYIGYSVGGAIAGQNETEDPAGTLLYVPEEIVSEMVRKNQWVDARTPHSLSADKYRSYYNSILNSQGVPRYGYTVQISARSGYFANLSDVGKALTQTSTSASGTISSADTVNNRWTVIFGSNNTSVQNGDVKIGGRSVEVTGTTVAEFDTPSYSPRNERIATRDGEGATQKLIPVLKIEGKIGITVPQNVSIAELTVSNILNVTSTKCSTGTVNFSDVACTLQDYETRIAALESRVFGP